MKVLLLLIISISSLLFAGTNEDISIKDIQGLDTMIVELFESERVDTVAFIEVSILA